MTVGKADGLFLGECAVRGAAGILAPARACERTPVALAERSARVSSPLQGLTVCRDLQVRLQAARPAPQAVVSVRSMPSGVECARTIAPLLLTDIFVVGLKADRGERRSGVRLSTDRC